MDIFVANANQKDGHIPCDITINIKNSADEILATYKSGKIYPRYQNPNTYITINNPRNPLCPVRPHVHVNPGHSHVNQTANARTPIDRMRTFPSVRLLYI